jgi:hypothetical protein
MVLGRVPPDLATGLVDGAGVIDPTLLGEGARETRLRAGVALQYVDSALC